MIDNNAMDAKKGRDRISLGSDAHEFCKKLVGRGEVGGTKPAALEDAPFETMKDVFMWAVAIGFQSGRKAQPRGPYGTIFVSVFNESQDIPLLQGLAIADTGSIDVLADRDAMWSIAEQYAQGGFLELRARIHEESRAPLWQLVDVLVDGSRQASQSKQP